MNKYTYIFFSLIVALMSLTGCIEDGISTSPSDQPSFSTDTLSLGVVFTDEVTTTHRFTVHNRHGKGMNISRINLSGPNASLFRLNVDGMSGKEFSDVEIRANDSIYVLVEATIPENRTDLPVEINADIEFLTNGITQKIVVSALGQDVERLRAVTLTSDTVFSATKPYQIFDSLVVAEGRTLTLPAGTRLYFHDGASMTVRGTLLAEGTAENPVTLCGDRTGNVITDITFDLMSRQWNGLQFTVSSRNSSLTFTNIRNTVYGVIVSGDGVSADKPKLSLLNSRLRNSGDLVLEAYDADIHAVGCEFAEASNGVIRLQGGTHTFNHCTFANYYLFSAVMGPALQFAHIDSETDSETGTPFTKADFTNCVIYGLGTDISHGDLTGTDIFLRNCLLKSNGSNDDNFIGCLWDSDPLYRTVREDYIFDYRFLPDSPAIGAGDPSLTLTEAAFDAYGLSRLASGRPDLGAYVFNPSLDE